MTAPERPHQRLVRLLGELELLPRGDGSPRTAKARRRLQREVDAVRREIKKARRS